MHIASMPPVPLTKRKTALKMSPAVTLPVLRAVEMSHRAAVTRPQIIQIEIRVASFMVDWITYHKPSGHGLD
jgi:hypothetical protein